jgi:hypothetical protein
VGGFRLSPLFFAAVLIAIALPLAAVLILTGVAY